MRQPVLRACLAIGLALAASQFAYAQTSAPGQVGDGQTHPVTVPPELQNAKPMPLPQAHLHQITLRGDSNRHTVKVSLGTIVNFKLDDIGGPGWTCSGGTIQGTSVTSTNGSYQAVAPGKSTVTFTCRPPAPKPGFAGSNLRIAYIVTLAVN